MAFLTNSPSPPMIIKLSLSLFAACLALSYARPAQAGWAEDALKFEADYIVNCSFTTQTKNNARVQSDDAAYGALNNVRVAVGADWVRPVKARWE